LCMLGILALPRSCLGKMLLIEHGSVLKETLKGVARGTLFAEASS